MSSKAKLTPEFITALINWQAQGSRSVKIDLDRYFMAEDPEIKIWVYDYTLTSGDYITCSEEIPSDQELLRKHEKDIEAQRRRLQDQLKALEV